MENYHPISLTSICSKLLEHIVYSSISRFLSDNHILSHRQHGCRPGHLCKTQLILSIDDRSKSLDCGLRTDMAIFDFSKAFDSVPHRETSITWYPRQHPGMRLFILNESRTVRDNQWFSIPWLPVTSGVPQGMVLGPLLLLLYINDNTSNIQSEILLFADDCIL